MRILKLMVCVVLVFGCCFSADVAIAKEPKEYAEEFFLKLQVGDVNGAYDGLFAGSGIPEMKPQAVNMLKVQTSSGLPMYGKVLGAELIQDEAFGDSVVRLVYILKQEHAPTVWQFFFYKPTDNWFLGTVFFNDQFQFLEKMN